jgi:hypothetical protein
MSTPGGMPWKGQAAAAGRERAYIDMVKVRGATFQLHEAAGIAGQGDEQLQARKDEVLEAVRAARADGFEVGEDYSVTDRYHGGSAGLRAERLAEADGHAAFIRYRVAALVAADQELTTQISAATQGINDLAFHETPAGGDDRRDRVQAVDRHWKQGPTPTPKPVSTNGPSADDIRRVLEQLPQGSKPQIREVRSPEELERLWEWMTQNGTDNPNLYGDPAKGEWKGLPDSTRVGRREAADSTKQPALDVHFPGENGYTKVHINPRGGVPNIPKRARPTPTEAQPAVPKPAQAPPLPDKILKLPLGPGLTAHSPATGPHPVYARSTIVCSRRCWAKNPTKSPE